MELAFIFGPNLAILPLLVFGFAVPIWAIIDAASHSRGDFYAAGSSRTAWIVILVISSLIMLVPVGFLLSCVYLLSIRHKVRRVEYTKRR